MSEPSREELSRVMRALVQRRWTPEPCRALYAARHRGVTLRAVAEAHGVQTERIRYLAVKGQRLEATPPAQVLDQVQARTKADIAMELAAARQPLVDQAETIGHLRPELAVAERRLLELEPGAPLALANPSPLTLRPRWAFWRRSAFPLL